MASGYPTVADNMPSLGMVNGPRPVSPSHSTDTLAPRNGWDEDLDISDFDSNGNINPVRTLDLSMEPSAHGGPSTGQSLYPDLRTHRDLDLGTSRTDPTASHPWHLNLQGQILNPNLRTHRDLDPGTSRTDPTAPHPWHLNLQGHENTLDGEPLIAGEGQPAPQQEGRLPPRTPTLDTMSWQIPPRTTKATPERLYKLKVYSTMFEQYKPSGERPFVVLTTVWKSHC